MLAAMDRTGPAAEWRRWWLLECAASADPAVQLARSQGFAATVGQLHECGWQRHDDRRELRRGTWSRSGAGVRTPAQIAADDPAPYVMRRRAHAVAATATALTRGDHVISGRSAAILDGLPTLSVPTRPELTAEEGTLGRRDGSHIYGAGLERGHVASWFGAPVTTAARTLVDLGRHDRRDAIMACDAALRDGLVTVDSLRRALDGAAGWPGVKQARGVLRLADARAESPLESLTRLALHDDGFPAPELQVTLSDLGRGWCYRVDFLLRDARLILEADGRVKYIGAEQWAEKLRETRLRSLGFRVERLLWEDVIAHWPRTSRWLRELLRAA